jgi:hypothetical protein
MDTTALQYVMRTMGQEILVEQFPTAHPLFQLAQKKKKQYGGRNNWEIDLFLNPTMDVFARSEGDSLETAGDAQITGVNVTKATIYVPVKITGHALRAQKLTASRIEELVKFSMRQATLGLNREIDRMLAGDGTGFFATCATTTNSATVQFTDDPLPWPIIDRGGTSARIDIRNKTTGAAIVEGAKVGAVSETLRTMVIDSLVTAAATDGICIKGNVKASGGVAVSNELDGLEKLVHNTSTYLTIVPSTTPQWASVVKDMDSVTPTMKEFQEAIDNILDRGAGETKAIVAGRPAIRSVMALYGQDRRWNSGEKLDIGFKGISFAPINGQDIAFVGSRHIARDRIYFLDTKYLWFYYTEIAQWRDYDGVGPLHQSQDEDALIGELILEGQFATDCRNAHGLLDNCAT